MSVTHIYLGVFIFLQDLIKLSLIELFHIDPVMRPRSAVLARGRPRANTADLGPVAGPRANTADFGPITGPIRNYFINHIVFNFFSYFFF